MLTSGDHALAQRDREISGLSLVLDADEVLALAARGSGAAVVAARPTYVRYKPATSCVVGYELTTTTDEPLFVYAKALGRAAAAKLDKAKAKEVRDVERWGRGVISLDRHRVMLAGAASDRDLPALAALAERDRRERLMRRLLPEHPDVWHRAPRAIRHKPERRWVGLAERDGEPVALIKAYRTADFRRSRAAQRRLATAAVHTLGWSGRRAVLASSWVPGVTLAERLAADPSVDARGVGAALAALHGTTPAGEVGGLGARRVVSTLGPAAHAVANVLPHLAQRVRRLADEVTTMLLVGDSHRCVVHGDFSADQVVVSGPDVHLIDFDQAHVADPASDLASFGAGLIRAELEGRLRPDRAATLLEELIAEHEGCGGPAVRQRLDVHLSAALLRLAVAPFRERHPEWPTMGEALVAEAEQALAPALAVGARTWR